jgi:hypothetical protein
MSTTSYAYDRIHTSMQHQFLILAVTYGILIDLSVDFYLPTPAQTVSGLPTCLYSRLSKITPLLLAVRALFG